MGRDSLIISVPAEESSGTSGHDVLIALNFDIVYIGMINYISKM